MLRHITNGMEDESIEISSSETVSDEDGDSNTTRSYFHHAPQMRKEVRGPYLYMFSFLVKRWELPMTGYFGGNAMGIF